MGHPRFKGNRSPNFGRPWLNLSHFRTTSKVRSSSIRSVAFKIHQNSFSAGLCLGPRWGSSRRSTDSLGCWGGDTAPHILSHSGPTHLRRLPCVFPHNSSQSWINHSGAPYQRKAGALFSYATQDRGELFFSQKVDDLSF